MKKSIYIITGTIALLLFAISCDDPYNDLPGRDTDYVNNDNPYEPTELDHWLQDNFTSPFNIEVKYRWDASELDIYKTLVPPNPDKVQEVMEVSRKVWIDPYVDQAGGNFIKRYCPKQFMLVGSPEYNLDGTIQLGTAEGGRKVVLYVVNSFDKTDQFSVKQLIHTIEHEFGHILHQNIAYPAAYKEITPGDYTANWTLVSLAEARAKGFITSYAMSAPDEDFVEMISMMLVEGKEEYEAIMECQTTAASRELLRRKEQMVVRYFSESYGIDFYALQAEVQEAINTLAPDDGGGGDDEPAPVFDVWGFNKTYASLNYDLSMLPEPPEFVDRYNYDNNILHQHGFALDYNFKLYFTAEEELTLTLYYHSIDTPEPEYYSASFFFHLNETSDGRPVLMYKWGDLNGNFFESELKATGLLSFFANRPFIPDWEETCGGERYVGIYPVASPENYAIGILGN